MDWVETLRNSGHAAINIPASAPPQKTVMVLGVARTGTTMVAHVVDELGVFMGKTTPDVYEDLEMAAALDARKGIRRLARQRDAEHAVWGFKRPEVFDVIRRADRLFRHPYAIVTFRDPLATGRREELSMAQPLLPQVLRAASRTLELAQAVAASRLPMLLVSYEKAIASPLVLVDEIIGFLELTPTEAQRERAVNAIDNGPVVYLRRSTVLSPPADDGVPDAPAVPAV